MRVATLMAMVSMLIIPALYGQIQEETISVETMADPSANWFISKSRSAAYIFDATDGEMKGLLSLTNYTPAVQPYAPRKEIYAAESYFSRGVHGDRTDVVTVYDFDNLSPVAEIEIPNKIAGLSLRAHIGLTANGRYLAVFNMTPGQSISIIDVVDRTFVQEISTAGCAMIMPTNDNDFLNICGDGTLQLIQLDADGFEANRVRTESFFSLDEAPVYDRPVATRDGWLLISHLGKAYNVSTEGANISISEPWSLLTDEQVEEKWRPGGHQLYTVHKELGLLYLLMHKGGEYTHHEAGTEIWLIDIAQQRRLASIKLEDAAENIMVTQESEPKLIVASTGGSLSIYDGLKLKLDRTITNPGPGVQLLEDF